MKPASAIKIHPLDSEKTQFFFLLRRFDFSWGWFLFRSFFDLQSFKEYGSSITAMKSTHHCKACGRSFEVDCRNVRHHSHCPDAPCQKARRALAQARRRASNRATRTKPVAPSRLQRSLKPSEADMLAEHSMFIGLIAMLTGSSDHQEIQSFSSRLYRRGCDILGSVAENRKNAPSV